jgi:hypothetical protein
VKFRSSHPPLIGTSAQSHDKVSLDDAPGGNENSVSAAPIASRFIVARPVFHAPNLSRFVFVSELARQKGTDASNAHDEEPTSVDAMDFSDDEEEARWKRSLKGDKGTGDKRKCVFPLCSRFIAPEIYYLDAESRPHTHASRLQHRCTINK